ncbi:MAG: hypothetical protein RIQ56_371 [Candidatus Parcubacteria bacterium]|jgi:hypothetical protein
MTFEKTPERPANKVPVKVPELNVTFECLSEVHDEHHPRADFGDPKNILCFLREADSMLYVSPPDVSANWYRAPKVTEYTHTPRGIRWVDPSVEARAIQRETDLPLYLVDIKHDDALVAFEHRREFLKFGAGVGSAAIALTGPAFFSRGDARTVASAIAAYFTAPPISEMIANGRIKGDIRTSVPKRKVLELAAKARRSTSPESSLFTVGLRDLVMAYKGRQAVKMERTKQSDPQKNEVPFMFGTAHFNIRSHLTQSDDELLAQLKTYLQKAKRVEGVSEEFWLSIPRTVKMWYSNSRPDQTAHASSEYALLTEAGEKIFVNVRIEEDERLAQLVREVLSDDGK